MKGTTATLPLDAALASVDQVDGTRRITLGSYERAVRPTHYGENIRIRFMKADAKATVAFQDGYTDPANPRSVAWCAAHDYLGPGATNQHKHFSIETSKADGTINTRMSFPYDTDRIVIETSDSDFMVGAGYLGVSHDATGTADLRWAEQSGANAYTQRWGLRRDNVAVAAGAGQNLRLDRFDDAGTVIDTVLGFERKTANISFFQAAPAATFGGGARVVFLRDRTTAPTTNPTGGGILYSEAGALKWRGSAGTVTTVAPA